MCTACVRMIFRSVHIKIQTCAYHVGSENQRYANSFIRTQIEKKLKNCHKMTIFQLVLSGCSVNNRKVVTIIILMQLLIIPNPYYTACNMLCIFSSYTIYMLSVQCLGETNCLPTVYS